MTQTAPLLLLCSQRPSQSPLQTYSRLSGRAVQRKILSEESQRNEHRVRRVQGCSLHSLARRLAALRSLKRKSPRSRQLSFPLHRTVKKKEGIIGHSCPEAKTQFTELFNGTFNRFLVHFVHIFQNCKA